MSDTMLDAMFTDDSAASSSADTGDTGGETTADDVADTGALDEPGDPGEAGEPEATEEPVEDPAPEAEAEKQPAETKADEPADVPEGATVRERNGKKEYVFPEARGKAVYEGYKTAQKVADIFGETPTEDVLMQRQNAHDWLSSQRVDSISPRVSDQSNVFQNIFMEAAQAIQSGEIAHDPLETMGEAFLNTLQTVAPEHFDATVSRVMNDRIQALYREAAQSGNERLLKSVQNLDNHLNGKWMRADDVAKLKTNPVDEREQRLAQREQQIQQHDARQRQQAWNQFHSTAKSDIASTVKSAIDEQIPATLRKAMEASPNGATRIQNISRLLDLEVRDAIAADPKWGQQVSNLFKQAQMAPTEQRREAIKSQIIQRYQQKARSVVQAKAKGIIDAESHSIKASNTATHEKLKAGSDRKATPPGVSKPVQRSIPSNMPPNATWDDFLESSFSNVGR